MSLRPNGTDHLLHDPFLIRAVNIQTGSLNEFHVPDTAPWLTKYGDANVTYVGDLSGIHGITTDGATLKGPRYNLSGQRVGNDYKGVVIINGQKQITK